MAISSEFYMHDSDRAALNALKAIPGFTQLFKAFMKIWNEKQMRIFNMSSKLRITEKQLPEYYRLLPPICERLGIEIPEMYLELDVNANAYTSGDTNPFIVITSGLLETLPDYLIPSVIAHECGHIACHHCLYTTMGRFIMNNTISSLGLGDLAIFPIQVAFLYWMRCSELSADRAAALCDGSAAKVIESCMRFAGLDKDIHGQANVEEFMNQASEYREMIDESKWNKTLEFLILSQADHPMNAVRAAECRDWCETERFKKIYAYLNETSEVEKAEISAYLKEIPVTGSAKDYVGKPVEQVVEYFKSAGFQHVRTLRDKQKTLMVKEHQVTEIQIDGKKDFEKQEWHSIDADVVITFFAAETEDEIAAAHPGQLRTPNSSRRYSGKNYKEVAEEFRKAGFVRIVCEERIKEEKGWFDKDETISEISINDQTHFEKGEWFEEKSLVYIVYMTYKEKSK